MYESHNDAMETTLFFLLVERLAGVHFPLLLGIGGDAGSRHGLWAAVTPC